MTWLSAVALLSLSLTLALVVAGRLLAERRGRAPFAWGLAAALFPPALLLLALLPNRQGPANAG